MEGINRKKNFVVALNRNSLYNESVDIAAEVFLDEL